MRKLHMASGRFRRNLGLAVPLALLSACSPSAQDQQNGQAAVVGNAIDVESNIQDAADDRADHLDQLAAERAAEADRASGAARQALLNESNAAAAEAAAVRKQGETAGADAADEIEQKAGLLNSN